MFAEVHHWFKKSCHVLQPILKKVKVKCFNQSRATNNNCVLSVAIFSALGDSLDDQFCLKFYLLYTVQCVCCNYMATRACFVFGFTKITI